MLNLQHPFVFCLAGLAVSLVAAQTSATAPVARLKFAKSTAAPGEVVTGVLTVKFAPGMHGYQNPPSDKFQIPLEVKVTEMGFTLAKITYPKGKDFTMAGEAKPSKVYEGTITIPLKLKAAAKPASYNVNVEVDYQQCNATSCFPPSSVIAKAMLVVK